MLQCHRQGVPTLLGLCVVAVAQKKTTSNSDVVSLPSGLQKYVLKLREWASEKLGGGMGVRPSRSAERTQYGDCPKIPRLSWARTAEALQHMRLLDSKLAVQNEADRYNINKFLNRLLGLQVETQNGQLTAN